MSKLFGRGGDAGRVEWDHRATPTSSTTGRRTDPSPGGAAPGVGVQRPVVSSCVTHSREIESGMTCGNTDGDGTVNLKDRYGT